MPAVPASSLVVVIDIHTDPDAPLPDDVRRQLEQQDDTPCPMRI